jgi:hypothetical protein
LLAILKAIKITFWLLASLYWDNNYRKKYHESAIQWQPFMFQVLFSCGGYWASYFGNGKSDWEVFWIIGCLASYGIGLWMCWKHAKKQNAESTDIVYALVAQAALPMALTIPILFTIKVIAYILGFSLVTAYSVLSNKYAVITIILLAIYNKMR